MAKPTRKLTQHPALIPIALSDSDEYPEASQAPEQTYLDFDRHRLQQEQLANSNCNTQNALLRTKDHFDDVDVVVRSDVIVRTPEECRRDVHEILMQLGDKCRDMLRQAEKTSEQYCRYHVVSSDVSKLLLQANVAQASSPPETRNAAIEYAVKAQKLVGKATKRIESMYHRQMMQFRTEQEIMLGLRDKIIFKDTEPTVIDIVAEGAENPRPKADRVKKAKKNKH